MWRGAAELTALQWLLGGLLAGLVLGFHGTVSVAAPALGLLTGGLLWPRLRAPQLDQPTVRGLATRAGALHAATGTLALLTLGLVRPTWFLGVYLPATALAGGIVAGVTGFVLALCGLNAMQDSWGPLNGDGT